MGLFSTTLAMFAYATILLVLAAAINQKWEGRGADWLTNFLFLLALLGTPAVFNLMRYIGHWEISAAAKSMAPVILMVVPIYTLCASAFSIELIQYRRKKDDLAAVGKIVQVLFLKAACVIVLAAVATLYVLFPG